VQQGPDNVIVPIILYHRIAVSPINSQYYVPPDKFEEEMKLLHDWEYTTITTELLVKAITEGASLPPRPILITFDDGHLNNYTTAFPIMQKYGFTGVLYIVGNYMGADEYMNAAQIKEMAAAGWEVGSHGMTHMDLTILEPERQRFEIVESRRKLENELGVPVLTFAYPFGISNEGVIDYVHFAGYVAAMSLGFTHDQGTSNLFTLQRRDIKGTYDVKQFAAFLPWAGDPIFLPTDTPTPTATPTRTKIPTYTQYPTKTPNYTSTPTP
jgi:peptidoglycan/xylan/chitin deacetylase (PgdA/CDA1 family)